VRRAASSCCRRRTSRRPHAEIYTDGLTLRVRDLGSRNGTFLNRAPVKDGPLHDGDVLHVGNYEFAWRGSS
jgi:pSer/pThr/pTyr-binding forkhead associated (FHA) protein